MAKRVEADTRAFPKHPKAPSQVLDAYPEIEPNLIDSYDACAILVDKRSPGALLAL